MSSIFCCTLADPIGLGWANRRRRTIVAVQVAMQISSALMQAVGLFSGVETTSCPIPWLVFTIAPDLQRNLFGRLVPNDVHGVFYQNLKEVCNVTGSLATGGLEAEICESILEWRDDVHDYNELHLSGQLEMGFHIGVDSDLNVCNPSQVGPGTTCAEVFNAADDDYGQFEDLNVSLSLKKSGGCAHGCSLNATANGMCDLPCYVPACNWDNGECVGTIVDAKGDACNCTGTPGDGVCDESCNTEACNYDADDCACARLSLDNSDFTSVWSDCQLCAPPERGCTTLGSFTLDSSNAIPNPFDECDAVSHTQIVLNSVLLAFTLLRLIFQLCGFTRQHARLDIGKKGPAILTLLIPLLWGVAPMIHYRVDCVAQIDKVHCSSGADCVISWTSFGWYLSVVALCHFPFVLALDLIIPAGKWAVQSHQPPPPPSLEAGGKAGGGGDDHHDNRKSNKSTPPMPPMPQQRGWHQRRDEGYGTITFEVTWTPENPGDVETGNSAPRGESEADVGADADANASGGTDAAGASWHALEVERLEGSGSLELHFIGADGCLAADNNGLSDPYVMVLAVGKRSWDGVWGRPPRTHTATRTLSPRWDERLTFERLLLSDVVATPLHLRVRDHDSLKQGGIDDDLGQVRVSLAPLARTDTLAFSAVPLKPLTTWRSPGSVRSLASTRKLATPSSTGRAGRTSSSPLGSSSRQLRPPTKRAPLEVAATPTAPAAVAANAASAAAPPSLGSGVRVGSVFELPDDSSLRARVLVALSCAADEARARLERALGLCLVTCSEAGGRRLESTANWLVHLHSDLSGDLSSDLAEPASGDLQAYYTIATDGPRAGQTSAVPIPASQLMHLYRLGVLPRDMKVWPVIGGKAWRSLGAEVDALEEAGSPRRSAEDEAAAKARIIQGRVRARQVRRSAVGAASKQQREGAVLRIQRNIREISRQQAARHIQWRSRQRQSRRGGGPP